MLTQIEANHLVSLFQSGRYGEAEVRARQLLERYPDNGFVWKLLCASLHVQGKDTFAALQKATEYLPGDAELHSNLGNVLRERGLLDDAVSSYRRALALNPALSEAHYNLGVVLKDLGKAEEAASSYRSALMHRPDSVEAHNNLGTVLMELGDAGGAAAHYRRAIQLQPDHALAHNNLGNALHELGLLEDAVASYRRALELNPEYAEAHCNLGRALSDLGDPEAARRHFAVSVEIAPDFEEAHYGLSYLLLMRGEFERGWREYEWRRQCVTGNPYAEDPCHPGSILPRPSSWLPVDFTGKHFHLMGDQGIGDELFFLRFVPEIRRRGGWVAYGASPKLKGLLERSENLDKVLGMRDCLPEADHALLVSEAPLMLGMRDEDPVPPPFALAPLPGQVARMRERLSALGEGPFLGVTWRAGTRRMPAGARVRPLSKETPIVGLSGATEAWPGEVLVLQRHPDAGEVEAFAGSLGRRVHDFSWANEDLEAMLALLYLLDDYVGVSNTNMHLRAGLGKAARVLVPRVAEWRWMTEGENSPWFPGCRLYRQSAGGEWGEALEQLKRDLVNRET